MNSLIVIPARGGSKGIPGKNIKKLNGKPLIYYTLEVACELKEECDIFVSTDDENIIKAVNDFGIKTDYKRPSALASDYSGMTEVILDALEYKQKNGGYQYDKVILLQPTSPFRTKNDVLNAIELYNPKVDMVVSVCETSKNPYYNLFEEDKFGFLKISKNFEGIVRRQDCPKVWEYNGCVYVINVNSLLNKGSMKFDKIIKYEMDISSSLDLDSLIDWKVAEVLINEIK